jgi:hypothetical protein
MDKSIVCRSVMSGVYNKYKLTYIFAVSGHVARVPRQANVWNVWCLDGWLVCRGKLMFGMCLILILFLLLISGD